MAIKRKQSQMVKKATLIIPESQKPTDLSEVSLLKPPENLFQLVLQLLDRIGHLRNVLVVALLVCSASAFIWSMIPEKGKLTIIDSLANNVFGGSLRGIYPGVEIDQQHLLFDLTEYTPAPPGGDVNQFCKVTTTDWLNCRRLRDDASYLARHHATTGMKPEFASLTHPLKIVGSNSGRIGGPRMLHFDILLDISKESINVPFRANLHSVRFGAFRDQKSEWAAATVFQPTRELIIELRFPASKPARNFRFSRAGEFDGDNYVQLTIPPEQYKIKGNTLLWTTPVPHLGFCYRVDWDW